VQNRINGLAEAVARSFKMHRPGREFSAASRYASGDQLTCCLVTPGRRPLRPDRSTSVGRVTVIAPERREALHRRALRLEYLTVGWNVLEAVVAIGAGVLAGSVALIAFGADSGIEIVSAVGLLWRLRKAGPYAPVGEESEAEKRALYVVAVTFFLLAVYIIYEGLTGLFNSEEPLTSPIGIALSLSSLVIMPILAYAKQRTGKQMGSRALVADSKETWVCSYLSLALLIGVGAYALFGWWWVDSLAALVMLPVIVWQGWETLAEAREHGDSD
jgi:cation diffusion facilitator family transporter